ncbi:hypothetical protein [Chlorobium phaeobacteroides]|uniref:Uncharacterized protein n=1 Tax=Chlorobium phaeobacteroides (strain DSM 266 / SMG 266 / 2430) TaxID=290317 RepID=A1BJX6_CHLPD|nr:hypothetical protein [Chlorobium phaeobacteroides]ABL66703.1 hypothetical protein Cpha266_2719 [Chlorobium phaeobacteroides DSM 266]
MIAVEEHKRPISGRVIRFVPLRPRRSVRRGGSADYRSDREERPYFCVPPDQVQNSSLPLPIPGAGSQGMMSAVLSDGKPGTTARHGSQRQPAQVGFPRVFPGMPGNRNDPETGKKISTERLTDLSGLSRLQAGQATWFDEPPASGGKRQHQAHCSGCYIVHRKRSQDGMIPMLRSGSFGIWEARRSKR